MASFAPGIGGLRIIFFVMFCSIGGGRNAPAEIWLGFWREYSARSG